MKQLQVLGPGCPKCVELAKRTEEAVFRQVRDDMRVQLIPLLRQRIAQSG